MSLGELLYNHAIEKLYNHAIEKLYNHEVKNPNNHEVGFSYTHRGEFIFSHVGEFNLNKMDAKSYYKKLIQSQKWVKLRAVKVANNPVCEPVCWRTLQHLLRKFTTLYQLNQLQPGTA